MPTLNDPSASDKRTLEIESLGAQGDGRATEGGRCVAVPLTLPGERVSVSGTGDRLSLVHVERRSPDRVAPPCRHFGACGGCTLQHLAPLPYAAFKRDQIIRTLSARGLKADVTEIWVTGPGTRRRAAFSARRAGKDTIIGFHARKSHDLVALTECPVLRPAITARLGDLRDIAAHLVHGKGEISLLVTETATGLDLHISGLAAHVCARDRAEATGAALAAGFARVTLASGDMLTATPPVVFAGPARVTPPPGGFLQASAEAEAEMARCVTAHLAGARRTADLFAGFGPFALRLATTSPVLAFESNAAAIAALQLAVRMTPGLKPVEARVRDLFRNPVSAAELAGIDGLVLDPPRAGAEAQAREIAKSAVQRVAYVSCDPATLARDLRILADGRYRILRIHPIDQFLWSAHVEAVALLERAS